jgi:hypothetical protein
VWHVRPEAPREPQESAADLPFDADEIERQIKTIEEQDRQWHDFFRRRKMRTLVLIYEDFVSSREKYEQTIRGICKYIGLPHERVRIRAPAFRRQADALSLEWEREYRRLKNLPAALSRPAFPLFPQAQVTVLRRPEDLGPIAQPVPASSAAQLPEVPATPASNAVTSAAEPTEGAAVPASIPTQAPTSEAGTTGAQEESSDAAAPAQPSDDLLMTAYDLNPGLGVRIATASPRRAWMDDTPNRFVYRCLPLVIANQHGWLLLAPNRITVYWTGGTSLDSLVIDYPPDEKRRFALSHFGVGILTFSMNFIFRTPPGYNLHVRGPANSPKDGIYPLEGIVETDWSEATFTMNWKMTRPNHPVVFEKDEPFAMLSPMPRGEIERFRPEIRPAGDNPELEAGYRAWARSRAAFNDGLRVKDSEAQKKGWERHYLRGETVSQRRAPDHQTGLSLGDFVDKRK